MATEEPHVCVARERVGTKTRVVDSEGELGDSQDREGVAGWGTYSQRCGGWLVAWARHSFSVRASRTSGYGAGSALMFPRSLNEVDFDVKRAVGLERESSPIS